MKAQNLEIERRFLLQYPFDWYAAFKLKKCKKKSITQTYLNNLSVPGLKNSTARVRRSEYSIEDGFAYVEFTLTYKEPVSSGINKEVEFTISQDEYYERLEEADKSKRDILKTRYDVPFGGRKFEVDVFKGDLEGLVIMEVELPSLEEKITLPPFFKVICEITDKKEYSNTQLASISAERLWKLAILINN